MNDGAWKDLFQAHVEGADAEREALYAALSDEQAQDPRAIDDFLALREVNHLLRAELSPSASDAAFLRSVCGALEKKRKQSSVFVLEVVNKNEKRRTTAMLRRRQRVRWSALAAAVLLTLSAAWLFLRTPAAPPGPVTREPIAVGHLVLLEQPGATPGGVTISRKKGAERTVVPGRTGEILYREDVLNTPASPNAGALAEMVLTGSGTVQVYPQTQLDVGAPDADHFLRLTAGRVLFEVPPLGAQKALTVRTPHALATVLGTRFGLSAGADSTRLEVYESKVRIEWLGADGKPVPPGGPRLTLAQVDSGYGAMTSRDGLTIFALGRETLAAEFRQGQNGYAGVHDIAISTQLAKERGGQGLTLFDDHEMLLTRLTGKYEKRVLLRFEGLALPPGAQLESADLELTFENFSGNQTVNGRYLKSDWNPRAQGRTGLGWLYRDTGVSWSEPGTGEGDCVPGQSFKLTDFKDGFAVNLTVPLDVEQVRGWIERPTENFGVVLIAQNDDKPLRVMASEHEDPKVRPLLRLRYSVPAGSVPKEMQRNPAKTEKRETF